MLVQAFYYKNLFFISQISGGDEWMTIRDEIDFDSISAIPMIKNRSNNEFKQWIERMLRVDKYKLRTFEY